MKQLLHNTPDGQHVIIGFGDTVFYFNYCHSSDKSSHHDGRAYELSREKSAVPCDLDEDGAPQINETTAMVDPNEVQAVAIALVDQIAWCAVARYDKSLTLYSIEISSEQPAIELQTVYPCTTHRSSKRISSLSFATVYGETPSHESLTVIVAGDLAGDANAYSLQLRGITSESDRLDDDDDDIVTQNRRLLLGHTASMLTCVQVVESEETVPRKQHIFTSDRDEKIRISQFPNTFCIQGYLLGHTAFVSSMAISPKTNRCVSVGGDHTLRLWDYTTFHELAVASITTETSEYVPSSNTIESEIVEGNVRDSQLQLPFPSKVAMSADGNSILTICDESQFLDFWMVRQDEESNYMLEHCNRLECQGQPLAVSFLSSTEILVVLGEPEYVQQFQISFDRENDADTLKHVKDLNCGALQAIRQYCSQRHIAMPVGLLEKDEYGCLKMGKMNERRSGATLKPWNNATRKDTNAERVKRLRKRRRDASFQSNNAGYQDRSPAT